MPNWILGFSLLFLVTGCSPRFVRLPKGDQFDSCWQKIALYNSQVKQIRAALDIRGLGLFGHHFHERADMIVQKPKFLLWSLRSFFDTPARIIASNGDFITMYDFTENSDLSYQKIELKANSVIDIFDFRFHPASLITILLAQVPLEGAFNVQFSQHDDLIQYSAELDGRWRVRGLFNAKDLTLLESSYKNEEKGLYYHVRYSEHALKEGVMFPNLYVVRASGASQSLKFEMRLSHSELNDSLLDPKFFYLQPR